MDQCERCQIEGLDHCDTCYLCAQDEEVISLNPVFDLFVDRTQSLLERWQRFYAAEAQKRSEDELQELQDKCLLGVICEISDGFTQGMIEEVNQRIHLKQEETK